MGTVVNLASSQILLYFVDLDLAVDQRLEAGGQLLLGEGFAQRRR